MPERSYACDVNVEFKLISKDPGFPVLAQIFSYCRGKKSVPQWKTIHCL